MITVEQAKGLKKGDIIYNIFMKDADGSPSRLKVNSKPKTWKTAPHFVQFTVKHGLRNVFHMSELDLEYLTLKDHIITLAEKRIREHHGVLFDVINEYCPGQMLDNIIHMRSFKAMVIKYLEKELEIPYET